MDEAAVWAEYERLGYDRGWVFAMTPLAWLPTAGTVMVGLNPGGGEGEHDSTDGCWEFLGGNAYLDDRWTEGSNELFPIQSEVTDLHAFLGLRREGVFAAQFIPFRSRAVGELPNYEAAKVFARKLWAWTLAQSPARLFLCMGYDVAAEISGIVGAEFAHQWDSGWGAIQVQRYVSKGGKVVVALPHPSRYRLFRLQDPVKAAKARKAIWGATRPAEMLT